MDSIKFPITKEELESSQIDLAGKEPELWHKSENPLVLGGCFVCFGKGSKGSGNSGDIGWAATVVMVGEKIISASTIENEVKSKYIPGYLALREGPILLNSISELGLMPDVLLINSTGRDHPRRAGLALHLGAILDIPTVGVTHRTLVATGEQPDIWRGSTSALKIEDEVIGVWLRTKQGTKAISVTPGWKTDIETATEVAMIAATESRTPEPIRIARKYAREARTISLSKKDVIKD